MKSVRLLAGLVVFLGVALNSSIARASADPVQDYTYRSNNGTITITGYIGSDEVVTIPSTIHGLPVASIGTAAFGYCTNLTSVTIPNSVTTIGDSAFVGCSRLRKIYFKGNAPSVGFNAFGIATVYYLPGTTGWGSTYADRPTRLWNPQVQTSDASFGVRTNRFGFTITGTRGLVIVVESCTDLTNPAWYPLQTNTLFGDSYYFSTSEFSDPQWTNYPIRFYRLRAP